MELEELDTLSIIQKYLTELLLDATNELLLDATDELLLDATDELLLEEQSIGEQSPPQQKPVNSP